MLVGKMGAALLLALSAGAAAAQAYPPEVIAHCARIVSTMHELSCRSCDVYRDRRQLACEAAGGRVLGPRFPFGPAPFDLGPTAKDRRAQ
jgi:hypothetical protein